LTLDLKLRDESVLLKKHRFLSPSPAPKPLPLPAAALPFRPLVVGAGPAGLFAALTLAAAGARPILIERGKPVEARTADVEAMAARGMLDPESNVQFGEGGAGAFSDGKLTCGVKSPFLREVLDTFVAHGAPPEIMIDQKPHIGTDRLRGVVASIRHQILSLGGEVFFETRLDKLILRCSRLVGAEVVCREERREIPTEALLLCVGHSARDTMTSLFAQGVLMVPKSFAMGLRIEHPRALIDRSQYGAFAGHPALGAASYKLVCHTPDGRGVYTFCMCPGGRVIAAASEPGGVVTNGMSLHARRDENSNAALLVGVHPEDFGEDHPLAGFVLQRAIERAAFRAGGETFRAPAQRVEDFLAGRETRSFGDVRPSYRPGVVPADLRAVLPEYITENLKKGIRAMDAQLKGFALPDAVLTGPETRSSSPIRLPRTETGEAEGLPGLYPVGEGAAGGIVSAAIDGISAARKVLQKAL
ncbi:MAG: FAD-binding protein, partial [Clostridia bacterium]|nr:FAD-binding protein [Clostridia bacterium]